MRPFSSSCRKTSVLVITAISLLSVLYQLINKEETDNAGHKKRTSLFTSLLEDYNVLVAGMEEADMWKTNEARRSCEDIDKSIVRPCIDTKCNAKVSTDPAASLASVLESMSDLEEDRLIEVTRLLGAKPTHKQVLVVTAASSNHYKESQALIHNLNEYVFPLLSNYTFVFYDLGLSVEESSELKKFCGCEVRTFPLSALPDRIKQLTCYTWKPLIVHANLPMADTLMWMDASVRLGKNDINKHLELIEQSRVIINRGVYPIAHHATVDMFNYFRESTCSFSAIPEFGNNYIGFKNDHLVREVVVKPWAACAVSPSCMCPVNPMGLLYCNVFKWQYNKCHRFDQSALGIILVKLFRNHDKNIRVVVKIRRDDNEDYFETLKQTNNRLHEKENQNITEQSEGENIHSY